MYEDDWYEKPNNQRMNGKKKHPFAVICRCCGSNNVTITAFEYYDLGIHCNSCGKDINCGKYETMSGDYSDC